jgi:site-specific DNA recombinase
MENFLAYIRVSTAKQGEKGVSLQEQKEAIARYAERYGLEISQWFEERETAAKRGRPGFTQMLRLLRQKRARGVIIHKIDRSARNLKDWADLGEMIDSGIEVHFANESLDLHTRGGRLSADIQAVVAADYIRNLREETRKGFYGRLKQGIYPLGAPIGYLDQGGARPKVPDPERAPLVAQAFELYSTGKFSLPRLLEEMNRRGLRNRRGGRLSLDGISVFLNNPFYLGVIRVKKTGELFEGKHEPIVNKSLFDRVQAILRGKTVDRRTRHDFTFRRMVRCSCGYSLIGELQKGHVYYRCQTKTCPTRTIREEKLDRTIGRALGSLRLDNEEIQYAEAWVQNARLKRDALRAQEIQMCKIQLEHCRARLNRLTDAFLDGSVERELFDERKAALLLEQQGLKERLADMEHMNQDALVQLGEFLELAKSAKMAYKLASPEKKRDLAKKLTSNLTVMAKNVDIELKKPCRLIAERSKTGCSPPHPGVPRIPVNLEPWGLILGKLLEYFTKKLTTAD